MAKRKTTKVKPEIKVEEPAVVQQAAAKPNMTKIGYIGTVKFKYKIGNKIREFKNHNAGLENMFRFLCSLLAWDTKTYNTDKPTYFDIRITDSTESCLYNKIPLSAPRYYQSGTSDDGTINYWVTVFDIDLPYNMLNEEKLGGTGTIYTMYLLNGAGNDFAKMDVSSDSSAFLREIQPGTQAIIEWTMKITNAE